MKSCCTCLLFCFFKSPYNSCYIFLLLPNFQRFTFHFLHPWHYRVSRKVTKPQDPISKTRKLGHGNYTKLTLYLKVLNTLLILCERSQLSLKIIKKKRQNVEGIREFQVAFEELKFKYRDICRIYVQLRNLQLKFQTLPQEASQSHFQVFVNFFVLKHSIQVTCRNFG